jgi:hypothetical protein
VIILAWATVLLFVFMCLISGLPEFIKSIDNEILGKHRKVIPEPEPEPELAPDPEQPPKLRVVE